MIPATDAPSTLERCLDAVSRANDGPDEVLVVDEPPRLGPAAARNIGIARATGDVIAFVDADVLIHEDVFTRIRTTLTGRGDVVAVFGSYDDRVATRGLTAGFRNLLHHTVHHRHEGPVTTFWAGIGAARRDALARAGGFDAARYPLASIEDIELGTRLAKVGTVLLDPRIQGTHLKEWTFRSMLDTDLRRRGVPWVRLLARQREVPQTLNLGPSERLSTACALCAGLALLARRPGVLAVAVAGGVALNRDLFSTVFRRLGPRGVAVGIPLHIAHQLTAAAAVPLGLTMHVLDALRAGRPIEASHEEIPRAPRPNASS